MAYIFEGIETDTRGELVAVMFDNFIEIRDRISYEDVQANIRWYTSTGQDLALEPYLKAKRAFDILLAKTAVAKKERPINEPTPSQERALLWAQQGILGIDSKVVELDIGTRDFTWEKPSACQWKYPAQQMSKTFLTVSNPNRATNTQMAELTQRVADIMGHRTVFENGGNFIVAHPGAVRNFRHTGFGWKTAAQITTPRR